MKTLYELAFNATLKNMELVVWKCNLLPKKILFALVCACLEDSPKVLAFVNLFKHWPLTEFSVRKIGVRLKDEDVILLASLIQKKQYGCIKLLNLLDIKFGVLSDRASNAILNALINSESVLSLKNYISPNSQQTSRSFSDALLYAQKSLFSPPKKASNSQNNSPPICNNLVIVMEFVINSMNIGKYLSLVQMQKNIKMPVSVIVSRLQFVYTSTTDIIKTLKVTNKKELVGVDISFNCLGSSTDRMKSVCNELKAFKNLEMLNLAYNNITEGIILTELLSNLQSLHYIDFSGNLLKSGINDLLEFGIQTEYLRTLILTGCSITIDCLHALVHSKKITSLFSAVNVVLPQTLQIYTLIAFVIKFISLRKSKNKLFFHSVKVVKVSAVNVVLPQTLQIYTLIAFVIKFISLRKSKNKLFFHSVKVVKVYNNSCDTK
ncbi:uncharacterized protein LOC100203574 isoform X2 [Hydra vulgaris]|uniref:uncharacterized protein LOC100203574 isoform X2 n=2 Tax=Hydra vulgaris TaxID=6087 RepID=UPI001F5FB6C3|nr:uncharacterized protein LOC100203574 isoform X1 [Hydra vulgaris]